MVATPNPWTGPAEAITLDTKLAGENFDLLMNHGFRIFLFWADRFVLLQWWNQIKSAVLGPGSRGYCTGYPSCVLLDSARSIELVFPRDARAVKAVSGTGAEHVDTASVYRSWSRGFCACSGCAAAAGSGQTGGLYSPVARPRDCRDGPVLESRLFGTNRLSMVRRCPRARSKPCFRRIRARSKQSPALARKRRQARVSIATSSNLVSCALWIRCCRWIRPGARSTS